MKKVTLLFLLKDGHILLAMKKRGFGQGRWNGVGGKTDAGETVEQAAVRECQEEIAVTPLHLTPAGRLMFYISDDPGFEGHDMHVFSTTRWKGEPRETEEMRPQWFDVAEIPYESMWADDPYWLPHLLAGNYFTGSVTLTKAGGIVSMDITAAD